MNRPSNRPPRNRCMRFSQPPAELPIRDCKIAQELYDAARAQLLQASENGRSKAELPLFEPIQQAAEAALAEARQATVSTLQ